MVDMVEAGHSMLGRTDVRGTGNGCAILSEGQVREARSLWVKGSQFPNPGSTRALATRYGVTVATMKDVLTCRSWAHVK
jgi:hypothetical protein